MRDAKGEQLSHLAASKGHVDILKLLVSRDVDLLSYDASGRTPMHHAALHGCLNCLAFLVEHDLDITLTDSKGAMPLHLAAARNHVNCVRFIVQQGCPKDAVLPDGKTAAHVVRTNTSTKLVHACA